MNPEVFSSGKNSGSNRDARLAEDTVRYRDRWTRKEERYRGLEERDENYKEIFYSRYGSRITWIGKAILALTKSTIGKFIIEQRSWYSSSIPPTIFSRTRDKTRTTCTTFSKLDTELPRDLTSLNDRPCKVFFFFFFLKLHASRSNTAGIQGPTRCMGGKSRRGKV